MPHTTAYITPDALLALGGGRIVTEDNDLPPLLARIVANVFADRIGESLVVGQQSLYYPTVITHSMPCDLTVVVVAWWTAERAAHHDAIQRDLNAYISWGLRAETHLVLAGNPKAPRPHW